MHYQLQITDNAIVLQHMWVEVAIPRGGEGDGNGCSGRVSTSLPAFGTAGGNTKASKQPRNVSNYLYKRMQGTHRKVREKQKKRQWPRKGLTKILQYIYTKELYISGCIKSIHIFRKLYFMCTSKDCD